jgi:hypothetical protein
MECGKANVNTRSIDKLEHTPTPSLVIEGIEPIAADRRSQVSGMEIA